MGHEQKISLFDTASRAIREFVPINPDEVTMYSCGMTVYYLTHIGHVRAYMMSDLLRRTLSFFGYKVRQCMNVTDVGHMVSDADEGEDKLEVGARREGKTPWELARFYEEHFFRTLGVMNIQLPEVVSRATDHIPQMISLVKRLEDRGFTYRTSVGIIFDTARFPEYANFARLQLDKQQAGARVKVDDERRQPWDFALWITNQPKHIMQWQSPWGRGFPGWHIECSAMAMRYLGEQIDIHTGGIDHIPIHHTNEIAQSECATGKKFANHWIHCDFLRVNGEKMSKSLQNLYTVDDVIARGYSPFALRYAYIGSHYRSQLDFRWDVLDNAQSSLIKLYEFCAQLPAPDGEILDEYVNEFMAALGDDLNGSGALTAMWRLVNSNEPKDRIARTLFHMDNVLGLNLANATTNLSNLHLYQGHAGGNFQAAELLAEKRLQLRKEKKFQEADAMRAEIAKLGYVVNDSPGGYRLNAVFRQSELSTRK